jgi:glutamate synthase domain-containing protein 3
MKEYHDAVPTLVVGGTAQDFLGEYMAGGRIVVFGLSLAPGEPHHASFIGTGMHNGAIYLRGPVQPHQLGREVGVVRPGDAAWAAEDWRFLQRCAEGYAGHFGASAAELLRGEWAKLYARHLRPYGPLYSWRN